MPSFLQILIWGEDERMTEAFSCFLTWSVGLDFFPPQTSK